MQAGAWSARWPPRLPGVREALRVAGERLVALAEGPDAGNDAGRRVAGSPHKAFDAAGEVVAEVELSGGNWYAFTADFIAWAARAARSGRIHGAGALGPVEAFGLAELERGCAAAGLSRVGA